MSESKATKNLRTEHRPGTQIDTDASHDYDTDKLESVFDPGVIPYHKPHERVRNDVTDTFFLDEVTKDREDADREGNSLERFKKTMKVERERNFREVKGDLLTGSPEVRKVLNKAAERASVAEEENSDSQNDKDNGSNDK